MRKLIRIAVVLAIIGGLAAAAYQPAAAYWQNRHRVKYQTSAVDRGTMKRTKTATGKIEPRLRVQIGAFVSGPIIELAVDYNDEVRAGDLLARIDPAIYQASVQRDEAALATQNAEVARVQAQLQNAKNDEQRGLALQAEDANFISQAELDRLRFTRMALEAQAELAKAAVSQAEANLRNSRANLAYTEIRAPASLDGIGKVIERKIDPGQTLAATFQTPELFILGMDMDTEMYLYASVEEADIGAIRDAHGKQLPVSFEVSAYPNELFHGTIRSVRMNSTETQNVVTYPVVVAAPNPAGKLMPGMTATITFQLDERLNVLRVPWAALRFFPKIEQVRTEDRHLLEGKEEKPTTEVTQSVDTPTAEDVVAARKKQKRHVWVEGDDNKLRAIPVELGISDYKFAECLSGELQEGMRLVTGIATK